MTPDREPASFGTVCVVGNGGWGTALALCALRNGARVRLWGVDPQYVDETARMRENPRYLPGVDLPEELIVTHDAHAACAGADLIISAVPTQYLRGTLTSIAHDVPSGTPVLSVTKGVENSTLLRPTEVIAEILGTRPLGVLCGPSHAEEVARGATTSVVVASADPSLRRGVQHLFSDASFRVYRTDDVLGAELAAAVKNVIAIAAGVCSGLELGDNAVAALITRGNAEIARLGRALGARPETFGGLAGIGDLIATCVSRHGRNRAVGERLGRGERIEDILGSMVQVAEGVRTAESVVELAQRHGVEMPICEQVARVLFDGHRPRAALRELMTRAPRSERETDD